VIDIDRLQGRIAKEFPDAVKVSDVAIKFTREGKDRRPYAVCYVDIAEQLPRSPEELIAYQDWLIGERYFEGPKSLQWNNYLYFIRDGEGDAHKRTRQFIESDRNYARKFVISEGQLNEVLKPQISTPDSQVAHQDILGVWGTVLAEAGIEDAILGNADLPQRLAWIEAGQASSPDPSRKKNLKAPASPLAYLRTLELAAYRPFPLQRKFQFGSVNLIVGPNAVGKTSLLEAIEIFYCGRSKRNRGETPVYDLRVEFANGVRESADHKRPLQLFRDRNLSWYGRPEIKTNDLYKSFAQFNFLDADAAVNITSATENLEDDLSKLLVGPDASTIWASITRVKDGLGPRIRSLSEMHRRAEDELASLAKLTEAESNEKVRSEPIATQLRQMLERQSWPAQEISQETSKLSALRSLLTEYSALVEQCFALKVLSSQPTLAELNSFIEASTNSIEVVQKASLRIAAIQRELSGRRSTRDGVEKSLTLLGKLLHAVDLHVLEKEERRSAIVRKIAWLAKSVAVIDSPQVPSLADKGDNVDARRRAVVQRRESVEVAYRKVVDERKRYLSLMERSSALASQLRDIAHSILETSPRPDECPLCHTAFGEGELATRISEHVDPTLEQAGRDLHNRERKLEQDLSTLQAEEAFLSRLEQFLVAIRSPTDVSVETALAVYEQTKCDLHNAEEERILLSSELEALEKTGFSPARCREIIATLAELSFSPPSSDQADLLAMHAELTNALSTQKDLIIRLNGEVGELEDEIQEHLASARGGRDGVRRELTELQQNLSTARSLVSEFQRFSPQFPWPDDRSLADLIIFLRTALQVLSALQAALAEEAKVREVVTQSQKRRQQIESELAKLEPKLDRCKNAYKALDTLTADYALTTAMTTALEENRNGIELIFSNIHAPPEFSGLGSGLGYLRRKAGGEASLYEISTGQRAAFALSIFLAQNSYLKNAPRLMLIDDPIAHVDDLNCLSFLDYVREVVLQGNRQIFFATANRRIATLFERKFDFLGAEEFCKIELSRPAE